LHFQKLITVYSAQSWVCGLHFILTHHITALHIIIVSYWNELRVYDIVEFGYPHFFERWHFHENTRLDMFVKGYKVKWHSASVARVNTELYVPHYYQSQQ